MVHAEETKVTITFTGNDDEATATIQRLEDMAQQSGVLANSDPRTLFATFEGFKWAWEFTGTPAALQVFLRLVEAYCK